MAGPYRSRGGLSTRPAAYGGNSDEVQVRIEPDFDDEVAGLRKQVRRLRDIISTCMGSEMGGKRWNCNAFSIFILSEFNLLVAHEIETEAKFQNDFLNQLHMTLIKAQAGVKNNMRRLNKSIIWEGSSHVMHVVLFALLLFFIVYLWSKFIRR